jgi:uncharacterized protein YyaL (SSP411 family)
MENQPLDAEAAAKKAKSKAAHRASMLGTGFWMLGCGVVAAYLTFGRGGDLPAFMYGHWRMPPARALPPVRPPAPAPLVHWRPWNEDIMKEALDGNRLIFLNLTVPGSRSCLLMDETTYNDQEAAAAIEKTFVPVRVDADARPDLVLRYFSGAWPTTAVLLPGGELIDGRAYMLPRLLNAWAQAIEEAYRRDPAKAADRYRKKYETEPALAIKTLAPSIWDASAHAEDSTWGGFFAGTHDYEKRLADQAAALAALRASDPAAAARTWNYVQRFLVDAEGGYFASQDSELRRPDGSVMEGEYYFAQNLTTRAALGFPPVDQKLFAHDNGVMAAAVLEGGTALGPQAREHALKTLDRWWKLGVKNGTVRHEMTQGVEGLLPDQVGLAEGYAAAFEAAQDKRQLDRAAALVTAAESRLMDEHSKALYDRPPWKELPASLDQFLVPRQNLEALVLYRRLVRDMPVGDPLRERLKARCKDLAAWLRTKKDFLNSEELAVLAVDDYNGNEGKP